MSACIDISHWQGFPDFEALAAQGVVACIMKATEGTSYVDPNRAANFVAATDAGIACACYFWLKPGDAVAQAQFFLDVVQPVDGERVVIDYEENGCTLDMLKDAVAALQAFGRDLQITVYSGHLLKQQLGDDSDEFLALNTDLWLAHYTEQPTWPSGTYPQWTLWQYTDQGELDGVETTVDLDHYNGSNEALLAWITPSGRKPPEPQPKPVEFVDVVITTSEDVSVTVSVNGAKAVRHHRLKRPHIRRGPDF